MMKDKIEMMKATANMSHKEALEYAKKVNKLEKREVTEEEKTRIFAFLKTGKQTERNALEILRNVPSNLYKVDKKGRYCFNGFYLIFKKNTITLAPTKKFRNKYEYNWEYHEGWANPYRSEVPLEFVNKAIADIISEANNE